MRRILVDHARRKTAGKRTDPFDGVPQASIRWALEVLGEERIGVPPIERLLRKRHGTAGGIAPLAWEKKLPNTGMPRVSRTPPSLKMRPARSAVGD